MTSNRACRPSLVFLLVLLILPNVQAAPAGTSADRYVLTEETVYDRLTNLTWQRRVAGTRLNHTEAEEHCASLSLGGWDDWRLPSVKELQSIVDVRAATQPAIDTSAFPDTDSNGYWSSTARRPGSNNRYWFIDFREGRWETEYTFQDFNVRCVR